MTRKLIAFTAAVLAIAACDPVSVEVAVKPAAIERPKFRIETDEVFSSASIGQYAGDHADIYRQIDSQLDGHIANIQRWLRQPSISAQNDGIQEMAVLLRDDLLALGFQEAELVPTDGHPGVWGYYDAGAEKTLMLYLMYDVQPVDPEDWQSPPFAAELVEHELGTVLMARGATNQKGPQRAFLNAVQSIIDVRGELPVNLMVTAEGEEELGSPHYPQIIDKYEERLKAAAGAIFPFNSQRPDGSLSMTLGVKGIIYFELEAKGNADGGPTKAEIHGSYKALVDSPVLRPGAGHSFDDQQGWQHDSHSGLLRRYPAAEPRGTGANERRAGNQQRRRGQGAAGRGYMAGRSFRCGCDHRVAVHADTEHRWHLGRVHGRGHQDHPAAHGDGQNGFASAARRRSGRSIAKNSRAPGCERIR